MKKKICFVFVLLFVFMQIFFLGCGYTKTDEKILRLRVCADSDSQAAQAVNAKVISAVSYYLSEELGKVSDYKSAYSIAQTKCPTIKQIACAVLRSNGCGYSAIAELSEENSSGVLSIRLGTGGGDDLQDVVFPQPDDKTASDGIVYKSLIAEIIGKRN